MAIDRAATLRQAEKLMRQGKLEAAIAAYSSAVAQQPTDWNTANTLGDLYVRVGQPDRAAEQFTRSADQLCAEGFLAKAAALYKKILKLKPDDERALLQAAEIAAKQGLFGDARAYFDAAADRKEARGDQRGATDARIRSDTLDANDFERRVNAARLRADGGDEVGALFDFQAIAVELEEKRRPAEAADAFQQALRLAPGDDRLRAQLVGSCVAAGDFSRAREYATSVDELTSLVDALDLHGRHHESVEILRSVARLAPGHGELALRLARAFVASGDAAAAAEFLNADTARADPLLLLSAAELQLRSGRIDDGIVSVRRFLDADPDGREQIAVLCCRLAEFAPEGGLRALDVAVEAAARRSDWPWAVAALQEFSRRAPGHVPALLRLVEIAVDAGLEVAVYEAQVKLADAHLASGSGVDARVIAEDLLDREPWEPAHVDRLRRALVLLGERNPDGVIAARLSGSPSEPAAPAPVDLPQSGEPSEPAETLPAPASARPGERRKQDPADPQFALGPNAIDIDDILSELDAEADVAQAPRPLRSPRPQEYDDVDLSVVLNEMKPIEAPDLDGVFEQLRDEVAQRSEAEAAEADYQRALALYRAGDLDGSIAPLKAAAREAIVRFRATALLARIFGQRGMTADAIEWFEHAAEAAPPMRPESHEVLYELAEALESSGEAARALAVYLELQTHAGRYRDVVERIDRLANTKTRG